jgi:hypothetical protein
MPGFLDYGEPTDYEARLEEYRNALDKKLSSPTHAV